MTQPIKSLLTGRHRKHDHLTRAGEIVCPDCAERTHRPLTVRALLIREGRFV